MDFLNITADQWLQNEEKYLNLFLNKETWEKIPLINANDVHNFKDGTLVRFRGMIQDMPGPEYYLERFEVINGSTKETELKNGKYRDVLLTCGDGKVDFDSANNVTSERHSYLVMSVPGLNQWVEEYEKSVYKLEVNSSVGPSMGNSNKRTIDDVMDIDSEGTTAKVIKKTEAEQPQAQGGNEKRIPKVFKHPLSVEKSKTCFVKLYKDFDTLKLNEVCDFVGFLSVNSFDEDSDSDMEIQAHNPPSSLVPIIHAVHQKRIFHVNPLLTEEVNTSVNLFSIKKELSILLTQLLLGDTLASEYLLCNLISEIYLRRDFMPLGKFSLNISNVRNLENIDYVSEVYKFLEVMLPVSHYLPITLENMNSLEFAPRKDYECNRLTTGLLQLSKNTLLLLDETKLQEGKLDNAGIQGVKALANAIKNQKITYDFSFYGLEYDCDIQFLTFSEGKSMLPSDVYIPLRPDEVCLNTFGEIIAAAKQFLKPELLDEIRKYLTQVRLINFEISDEVQNLVQQEFVNMRQNSDIKAEDLHSLLVLARLLCISEGRSTMDAECWKKACHMEHERKSRIRN